MNCRDLEKNGYLAEGVDGEVALQSLSRDEAAANQLPLVGRLALGFGAWLAGIFFIGFIVVLFDFDDELVVASIGALLAGGSVFLLRMRKGIFLDQLALALSLAGHLLTFFGLHDVFDNELAGAFVAAVVLCGPVYWFSNHSMQRFFSVFWIYLTWWGFSAFDGPGSLNSPLMLLMLITSFSVVLAIVGGVNRLSAPVWKPALWASITGLSGGLFWLANMGDSSYGDSQIEKIFGVAAAMGCISVLWHLIRPQGNAVVGFSLLTAILVVLAILGAPGVLVSLGLIAIAHARGDQALEGVAIVLLGVFLIAFYYHLGIPLNQKSITLMSTGVVLLVFRWCLGRAPQRTETELTVQNDEQESSS